AWRSAFFSSIRLASSTACSARPLAGNRASHKPPAQAERAAVQRLCVVSVMTLQVGRAPAAARVQPCCARSRTRVLPQKTLPDDNHMGFTPFVQKTLFVHHAHLELVRTAHGGTLRQGCRKLERPSARGARCMWFSRVIEH